MNISILDVVMGLCTLLSGGIMLSNFTWDESDGGGEKTYKNIDTHTDIHTNLPTHIPVT